MFLEGDGDGFGAVRGAELALDGDGRFRGRNSAAVSHVPEFVLLTTEAKWYRNNRMTGKGVPELDAAVSAGDDFVVDYVRVYDVEE